MWSKSYIIATLLSTVNAVHYYGDALTSEGIEGIEKYNSDLGGKVASIGSVFASSTLDDEDTQRFLDDINMHNMTWYEAMDLGDNVDYIIPGIHERAPINYECRNGGTVLSSELRSDICDGIASLAGGGAAALTVIVDLLTCTGGGRRLKCHATIAFFGGGGGTISVNQVNRRCPALLAKIRHNCNGHGGKAQSQDELTIKYDQGSQGNCRDQVGNCKVENN